MNRAERRRQKRQRAKTSGKSVSPPLSPERLRQIDALLAHAYKALQSGEETKAGTLCDQVLGIDAHNFDAWLVKGVIARRNKELDTAIGYFEKALSINPERADAHTNLGNAFRDRGDLVKAAACYQASLAINPKQIVALNNLSLVRRGLGEFEAALELAGRVLELNPEFTEAHINRGAALACLDRYEEALPHFEKAQPSDPSYLSVPSAVANCLVHLRASDRTAAWIKARASGPSAYLETVYTGDDLATALKSGSPSDRLKGRLEGLDLCHGFSEEPTLYISGDTTYLDRYLEPFCASFCETGNTGRIHVHALTRDAPEAERFRDQMALYDAIDASLSYEVVAASERNRVYYSTIRFAVLSALYAREVFTGPVFAVDIDSSVRADLSSLWAHFAERQASVGLFERKTEFIEQQVAAGALYLAGNDVSRRFIADVGAYICHSLMDRSAHWYLDQIALWMVRLLYLDAGQDQDFVKIPTRFLDWRQTPDGVIWTDKGAKNK